MTVDNLAFFSSNSTGIETLEYSSTSFTYGGVL